MPKTTLTSLFPAVHFLVPSVGAPGAIGLQLETSITLEHPEYLTTIDPYIRVPSVLVLAVGGFGILLLGILVAMFFFDRTRRARNEAQIARNALEAKLLHRSAEVAAEATSVDAALRQVIDAIVELMGWQVGEVYKADTNEADALLPKKLFPDTVAFEAFREEAAESGTFARGAGLPERIMETGEVAWIADVWADQQFPQRGATSEIKGALGLPVKVAGNVVAVLQFFSTETMQPDENLIRILTNVANQLSRVFERRHAQTQLTLQSAALRAADEGIGITDLDGTFVWVNPAFTTLTGYAAEEVVGQNARLLKSGAHDQQFYQKLWHTILMGNVWTGEVINRTKDGRLYTEEQSITPVRDDHGKIVNFVAIKRDITERKRMEEELEIARLRMEDELNVGREIQMSMLPLTFPAFPERGDFSVYAALEPAREVGGDFYDFFLTEDGRFCFCVGDVSGKGVPSALFMAVTKTLINSRGQWDVSPASIISHVNAEIGRHNEACMFVTIFLGILDVNTGELCYTNAGHNPPYLMSRGEVVRLDQRHGPVVGAVDGIAYGEDSMTLAPGDQLVVYSDGVTEAMNEDHELYSESRLAEFLSATRARTVEGSVDSVMKDVWRFQGAADQADDVTVLAVVFNGHGTKTMPQTLDLTIANRMAEIDRVNQAFRGFAEEHGIPFSKPPWSVMFDELLNNIISYAFDDDDEHVIDIRIVIEETRITVTITDDGIPFDPFSLAAPDTTLSVEERGVGGLGIHLVRNLMDDVSYERVADRNIVTCVSHRPTEDT